MNTEASTQQDTQTKTPKKMQGTVTSTKMQETATVEVVRYTRHPKYGKFIKRMKKYHAHNEGNKAQEGDLVTIVETRPMSKTKHFKII